MKNWTRNRNQIFKEVLLVIGLKSNIGDHEFLFCVRNPHTRDFGIFISVANLWCWFS